MNRRSFFQTTGIASLASQLAAHAVEKDAAPQKPAYNGAV